jgi:hypothetical protein
VPFDFKAAASGEIDAERIADDWLLLREVVLSSMATHTTLVTLIFN